ncbi:MAG: hypothetical protein CND86_01985 [Bacteroidetes bacterium MED-G21]|nr:MAG: hypothetical protein CND86_01985 [Bacteroidetes bacterium MED-G21]
MKKIIFLTLLTIINYSIKGQNKGIVVEINHLYDGELLNLDSTYILGNNIPIRFDRIEYYIHLNSLISNQNIATDLIDKYILVNANQNNYNIGEIELLDDDLISLNFNIGVEYNLNHADPSLQDSSHPLAPQLPSMHWGWAAGYRFVALEGMIDKNQDSVMETVFQYHPVDDSYYSDTITCNGIIENENNVTIFINANYDRLIENIGTDEGGVYHGIHEENGLLMDNFSRNNVFTVPENLNLKETLISNTVFPNPFSNTIQLNLNENSIVKVYNSIGILVDAYKLDKGQQQINTQTLLNGVYILSLQSKSGTENIKLLKN